MDELFSVSFNQGMPPGIELQNIVSKYVPEGCIYVSRFPGWISRNIKEFKIEYRYYIFSTKKLNYTEMIYYVNKYKKKINEQ